MNSPITTLACDRPRDVLLARCGDYLQLTKPKIALLELVVALVAAMLSGWDPTSPWVVLHALAGTALVAASASALNQWLERDADKRMHRTAARPLPAGRLGEAEARLFAVTCGVAGLVYLAVFVGPAVAGLGLATWLIYVGIYTPLKVRTTANTCIGAVAGAMPVLMGAAAAGNPWTLTTATLYMIVFLWQFPHFMAIAWLYRHDYAAAGMKMLPTVERTGRRAGAQAVLAAAALVPVGLLPVVLHAGGLNVFFAALILAVHHLAAAVRFLLRADDDSARGLLRASLIYLPAELTVLALLPI